MQTTPHKAGPLDVSEPVRRQIVRIHLLEGTEPELSLDVEAVRQVEAELGVRLPDDILAIMASNSQLFCHRRRIQIELVIDHQRSVEESDGPADVFAVGEQPNKYGYYVIEEEYEIPPFILEYDAGQRSLSPWALENWMERKIGDYLSGMLLEGDRAAQERAGSVPSAEQVEAFEPRLA
ncbi:MAG: hypothetical protein ACQEVA_18505 [Myxococcota bacterium]